MLQDPQWRTLMQTAHDVARELRYAERPVFEIDGCRFSSLEEFFGEVTRVLLNTSEWGRNLDAFNDILRGGFGTPEGGFVLEWKNYRVSQERLGYPETIRQLERRLERCHPANRSRVADDLARSRRGEGETVFDWLVEIIRSHGRGGDEQEDRIELVFT